MGEPGASTPAADGQSYGRYDFSSAGKQNMFGVAINVISTPYGDMRIVRNVHLD